jgi:hypothetical protein
MIRLLQWTRGAVRTLRSAMRRRRHRHAARSLAAVLLVVVLPRGVSAQVGVDCNADGGIDETDIAVGLRVAQGIETLERCAVLDRNRNGELDREEIPHAAPNTTMSVNWRTVLNKQDLFSVFGTWGVPFDARLEPGEEVQWRNLLITSRYVQLHDLSPESFLWAGCAAFISNQGGLGLGVHESLLALWYQKDLDLLRKINTAVFHDVAWAHLAFRNGGARAVKAGLERVADHEDVYEGFRKIEEGEQILKTHPTGANPAARQKGIDAIWKGNELLLRHEQSRIIQEHIQQLSWWFASALSVSILVDFDGDNFALDWLTLTGFARTMIAHGRWGDITRFEDRWLWIEESILPRWRAATEVEDFDERRRRLIEGLLRASNPIPRKGD